MWSAPPSAPLDYYAGHGSITDPGEYADLFGDLPGTVPDLCAVIQGLLVHFAFLGFYGLKMEEERKRDRDLRYVHRLLARIVELDSRPLTVPRPPEKRLVVCCRDYATLLCAVLRHQGLPARARCGFARYFHGPRSTPGFQVDHWVCEYWNADEQRWVLVDAEVGEDERAFCHVEVEALDVPRDQFLVAGKAWQMCRQEGADPDSFGLAPDDEHGLWYVQSQLVRDLAALNKRELLCWDCWALGDADPDRPPSGDEFALLDRVAMLTQAGPEAFAEMRALYEGDPRLRVPAVVKSYTMAGPRMVDLGGR